MLYVDLINEFNKLASFDSESYKELDISLYLYDLLNKLGLSVTIDDAGKKLNDNPKATGNIYAFLKGNTKGEPIVFSSHLDTVLPCKNKKIIVDGNIVKTDGNTILGSDDITGIISIIYALKYIIDNNVSHPDIEVVFFIAEEEYCKGSSVFDFSKIKSKYGYVLDLSGKVGQAAYAAPTIISFSVDVYGKSSHAGFEPEKGISSIIISSEAISKLKLGRIDNDTTANIGTINGGSGKNIVPYKTTVEGEIRSYDNDKAYELLSSIKKEFEDSAKKNGGNIEFNYVENIKAYEVSLDSYVVNKYKKALNTLNYGEASLIKTFGGSDNNNFNKNGIEGIVISNAMNNIHTTNEYFDLEELVKSINIVIQLMKGE